MCVYTCVHVNKSNQTNKQWAATHTCSLERYVTFLLCPGMYWLPMSTSNSTLSLRSLASLLNCLFPSTSMEKRGGGVNTHRTRASLLKPYAHAHTTPNAHTQRYTYHTWIKYTSKMCCSYIHACMYIRTYIHTHLHVYMYIHNMHT